MLRYTWSHLPFPVFFNYTSLSRILTPTIICLSLYCLRTQLFRCIFLCLVFLSSLLFSFQYSCSIKHSLLSLSSLSQPIIIIVSLLRYFQVPTFYLQPAYFVAPSMHCTYIVIFIHYHSSLVIVSELSFSNPPNYFTLFALSLASLSHAILCSE